MTTRELRMHKLFPRCTFALLKHQGNLISMMYASVYVYFDIFVIFKRGGTIKSNFSLFLNFKDSTRSK